MFTREPATTEGSSTMGVAEAEMLAAQGAH